MTFDELLKIAEKTKTNSRLDEDIPKKKANEKQQVYVCLHIDQWIKLRAIMTYHQLKGDYAWNGISQAIWHLIDKAFLGIETSMRKKEGINAGVPSKPSPKPSAPTPSPAPSPSADYDLPVEYENPFFIQEDAD